jgi:ribulose-bisphosphate carboxylase large chain
MLVILGARGLLVAPLLVGPDTMRQLAEDDTIGLPVYSHPTFLGRHACPHDSSYGLGEWGALFVANER